MPLSRILWLLILKHESKGSTFSYRTAGIIKHIQSSIGNSTTILCRELQNEYWFNNVYLTWKAKWPTS